VCRYDFVNKKAFQMADWSMRPVRQSMRDYAAIEVFLLINVYEYLNEEIDDKEITITPVAKMNWKALRRHKIQQTSRPSPEVKFINGNFYPLLVDKRPSQTEPNLESTSSTILKFSNFSNFSQNSDCFVVPPTMQHVDQISSTNEAFNRLSEFAQKYEFQSYRRVYGPSKNIAANDSVQLKRQNQIGFSQKSFNSPIKKPLLPQNHSPVFSSPPKPQPKQWAWGKETRNFNNSRKDQKPQTSTHCQPLPDDQFPRKDLPSRCTW